MGTSAEYTTRAGLSSSVFAGVVADRPRIEPADGISGRHSRLSAPLEAARGTLVYCLKRIASYGYRENRWTMLECVTPDGLKPEALPSDAMR